MNLKARETIKRYSMLEQGDTVVAAVSGGADSVALLHFFCSLTDLSLHVRACHLNHCLRGEESDRDERLVRTMCREYGIPLDVIRVEIGPLAKERRQSLELTAREERYRFFESLMKQYAAKIATAHTLSDTAETVLFHLARGTGMDGLCGIPPVRDGIIRPLIACSRAEIEEYCNLHGLCYVTDSTNAQDDYTRNYIRHNIVPGLTAISGGTLEAIDRMTRHMRLDADFLRDCARDCAAKCAREGGLDTKALLSCHPAMRARVLLNQLDTTGADVRSEGTVVRMEAMLFKRSGRLSVGGGWDAVIRDGLLTLERCAPRPPRGDRGAAKTPESLAFSKKWKDSLESCIFNGKKIEFIVHHGIEYEIFKNNHYIDLNYAMDYDKIGSDIFVRYRQSGDRIRLPGRGCSKTLKKLYNELSLPSRDRLCVLADEKGILFAEGSGVDERVQAGPLTKTMIMVEITEDERLKDDAVKV